MPRSRNYPAFGLGEALDKVRKFYDTYGKAAVPRDVAVQSWGYTGLNGRSLRVLGALNQYGLLDSPSPKAVKLSDTALAILLEPEDSQERHDAISRAAGSPAVFGELQNLYPNGLPPEAAVVSYLVRNQGFNESAARDLIASFHDTFDLVQKAGAAHISTRASGADAGGPPSPAAESISPNTQAPVGADHMEFNWPLSGKATATLTVTRPLELDDIETLTAYFEIAKKALAKAASNPEPDKGEAAASQ